ncbi:MAG TPA: fluoride efflux transporter CrcB [Candidatus Binatia bacterium]|nr:fluoride efflux transporter CrcB [Candidatus Binatia bacterium]
MIQIILVGAGSFLGGVLRYAMSAWVHRVLDNPWFPYGTLAVNGSGCLVIGFLAGLAETRLAFTPETRLFLFVGILGGFTTFSSFALETFSLVRDTQSLAALVNISLQLVLGLLTVWIGNMLAHALGG